MSPRHIHLLGLGVAAPPASLDQETAIALAQDRCANTSRQRAWIRRLYRHTGIQQRGSVLLGEMPASNSPMAGFEAFYPPATTAEDRGPGTAMRLARYEAEAIGLGESACRRALEEAGTAVDEITHLVTVSCTGMVAPGLDAALIQRLGLPRDLGRLSLGFMGCHGALNGLRAASGLAQDHPRARVLVCCVELCSLHFQYGFDTQKVLANGLFADGAAATVIGPAGEQAREWRLVDTQSHLSEGTGEAMTWRIGDHGFEMTLSSEVPRQIRSSLHQWTEQWLASHDLTIADIRHWAIHPGGPDILRAAREALSLPDSATEASSQVLAEHGNMSSPTVLFILERLRRDTIEGPCVVMGFGPGLSLEAALIDC
ncbi:type III polyketide synthase [Litchfieldella xinjiangensis]|uniref:type III polyketide synthase n=1 Tax=Litchfieldella xinjiangensis TaxID=1166948 RepID=UPI0005B94FBD|nr:type III polyketide synthase [Halomonas xinjiangensis]